MATPRVLGQELRLTANLCLAREALSKAGAIVIGTPLLRANGNPIDPVTALTQVRVIAGTAALVAVAAVFALGVGVILRHGAGAVTVVVTAIILPYLLTAAFPVLPVGAADWLLRITPAAGFAAQQAYPQYPQVNAIYSVLNGYFPLAWWAGLLVLCGWAAAALAGAALLLRRRDA